MSETCTGFGDCACDVCWPPEREYPLAWHFFVVPLTRRERIRQRFSWHYIRQTRFLLPLTMWWLNRG